MRYLPDANNKANLTGSLQQVVGKKVTTGQVAEVSLVQTRLDKVTIGHGTTGFRFRKLCKNKSYLIQSL